MRAAPSITKARPKRRLFSTSIATGKSRTMNPRTMRARAFARMACPRPRGVSVKYDRAMKPSNSRRTAKASVVTMLTRSAASAMIASPSAIQRSPNAASTPHLRRSACVPTSSIASRIMDGSLPLPRARCEA
jgi:hypothetical protein